MVVPLGPALLAALFLALPLAHVTGLRNSLAFLLAAWALVVLLRERLVPPLAGTMGAWLAVGTVSAIWAPSPIDTLKAVGYDGLFPAGAFCAAFIASRTTEQYRFVAAAAVAIVLVLAAFVLLGETMRGGRVMHYYPGEGAASTLCVFVLPFAWLLTGERDAGARFLGFLGLACVVIAGFGTGNRMFWLSALATLAALYAWQWQALRVGQRMAVVALLAACSTVAIAMVVHLTGPGNLGMIVERDNRLAAWKEWGDIALQAPVLGYGFGLKAIKETARQKLSADFVNQNREMEFHAHGFLFDLLVQVGMVGLAVFMLLLAALAREAWRARDHSDGRRVGAALIGLIVAMLTKNATDDFMHHAVVIAFWGLAGVLVGRLSAMHITAKAEIRTHTDGAVHRSALPR